MESEDELDGAAEAARAFDDLRAEVSVLRRAIEVLPGAWEDSRPPDYSPDLGRIVKGLTALETRLAGVEAQPALTRTPEAYAAAIRQAGKDAVAKAVEGLAEARQETTETGRQLASMIGAARSQQAQRDKVFWIGGIAAWAALVAGLVGAPYFDRIMLPDRWDRGLAAIVMDADRWNAGEMLMQAAHPNRWDNLVAPWKLINGDPANAKAVAACQAAVAKTGKAQACRIVVPAGK
jgi:hypothetical protein